MNRSQIGQLARLGLAMPGRLRRIVTHDAAVRRVSEQQAARESMFLESAARLIFAHDGNIFHRLLRHAGCDHVELTRRVRARGLEATLAGLRDAGVRLSLEEFKGLCPIERPGLLLSPINPDLSLNNPDLAGDGISGTTSGSRSEPTRVMYDWSFIAEEAAHERILYETHGVFDAPLALWYPVLPGVAGIHNLLMSLQCGRAPERWFSQLKPSARSVTTLDHLALLGLRAGSLLAGRPAPAPEWVDTTRPDAPLDWARARLAGGGRAAIRTFASSAVRLAEHARARAVDLTGLVLFTGGEPLTDTRRRYIESTGAAAFPRYVATEAGLIAAACPERRATDSMHVYTDRIAIIPGEAAAGPVPLLLTTLTHHTPKVLLNTEMGDAGALERHPCGCAFGRLGLDLFVADVSSRERLTLEGMTVPLRAVNGAIERVVERLGGPPDSWQSRVESDAHGSARLVVAISPVIGDVDITQLSADILERVANAGPGLDVAAEIWRSAGTIVVVRESPRMSDGAKLLRHVDAGAGKP